MVREGVCMRIREMAFLVSLGVCICAHGVAQAPLQPVQWKVSLAFSGAVKQGSTSIIELSATIQDGWHVYGLVQQPGGPTPLRVALGENVVAQSAGEPSGSAPIKKHDPSFDLDTQIYAYSLSLHVPIQVRANAPAGTRGIPIGVRFQACSGQICLPPRTVHVSAPIEVLGQ